MVWSVRKEESSYKPHRLLGHTLRRSLIEPDLVGVFGGGGVRPCRHLQLLLVTSVKHPRIYLVRLAIE